MKAKTDSDFIYQLISEGEHLQQGFKFEISDVYKIAKSLSAFANTSGGRLLIGVKDNGKIAGVRSEEEIYMIEAAATLYCKPEVPLSMQTFTVEGRTVLIAHIPEGTHKPYCAKDENGKQWAYIRIADENILASPVHLKIWKQTGSPRGALLRYSEQEEILLHYLQEHEYITLNRYCKLARISKIKAETTLARFIRFKLIEIVFENRKFQFRLLPDVPLL